MFFYKIGMKQKIVILTGAGMSAESGIKTFRDSNGLWENHRIEEVASPIAWANNPEMVMRFYNIRRKQLFEVGPNEAHKALVGLEEKYDVAIVTQNVDDLHERAGSKNVLHLHGELKKARSTVDPSLIYEMDQWELKIGDKCEKGSQLRPHIVWFGEPVPQFENAVRIAASADIFIIIGTSLFVYPAAGLINFVPQDCKKYLVDPKATPASSYSNLEILRGTACGNVPGLVDELLA